MVHNARREVESDLEIESIYSRNNIMNTTNQSISSTINQSDKGKKGGYDTFSKKQENIREDWGLEEGSSVEQA